MFACPQGAYAAATNSASTKPAGSSLMTTRERPRANSGRRTFTVLGILAFTACLLTGCASGSFDRFMDHPILSWLPLDASGVVAGQASEARFVRARFPDKDCFEVAQQRAEAWSLDDFDPATLQEMFEQTYRDCVARK
jgi:hypothetical protein